MYNKQELLFCCFWIAVAGLVVWRLLRSQRWGLLEYAMTLVGGTFPVALISQEVKGQGLETGLWALAPFTLILLGGIAMTAFGSRIAMRWIFGLELHRSLWRAPVLLFGWLIVVAVPLQVIALIYFPFVVFAGRRDLSPVCMIAAATLPVWLGVMILNRKVKSHWARIDSSIDIWTRN